MSSIHPHSQYPFPTSTTSSSSTSTPTTRNQSSPTSPSASPSPPTGEGGSAELTSDLRASIEAYLTQTAATTSSAPDTTTDLVTALLGMLQRQNSHADPACRFSNSAVAAAALLSLDDCSNKSGLERTTATTTATASPSHSGTFEATKFDDITDNMSCDSLGAFNFKVEPSHHQHPPPASSSSNSTPSTTGRSSNVPQPTNHSPDQTTYAPLLNNDSAAQWSNLADILAAVLQRSTPDTANNNNNVSPMSLATSFQATNRASNSPKQSSGNSNPFHSTKDRQDRHNSHNLAPAAPAATNLSSLSDRSSPSRDPGSIFSSSFSPAMVATLNSPANPSLTSLSSLTVADFSSILSAADSSLSGLASPRGMTSPGGVGSSSRLDSPSTVSGRRNSPGSEGSSGDGGNGNGGDLTRPMIPALNASHYRSALRSLRYPMVEAFRSAGLSPPPGGPFTNPTPTGGSSSNLVAASAATTTAATSRERNSNGELADAIEGQQCVGTASSAGGSVKGGDDGTGNGTPRSLLFHPDGSLNLEFFKVFSCKNESHVHDRKNCPFHHSHRDRRRQPINYNAEQCDDHFDVEGDFVCSCPNGDNCDKCHNRHELLYHPGIYKQRFCSSYNHLECHRGRFCAFAHTRGEIRCDLFAEEEELQPKSDFFMKKFKTLWCPYGVQHDWHGCLYAHTYQDCRRSPDIGYGSEPCPYWQKDLHSADYQKRCPFGPRCPYSHGSKEQLYHPAYYKTMPCADYKTKRNCPRSNLCAFYHDISEKRAAIASASTPGTEGAAVAAAVAAADVEGSRVYDYTRAIPNSLMNLLQPNFMRPPLFNLDDFEAFGHACRVGSGCRESRGNGPSTPHSSNNRIAAFPPHPYPNSPGYPSIQHQYQLPSIFRAGMNTPPDGTPSRTNAAMYRHQQHAVDSGYNNHNGSSTTPNLYGHGHFSNYNPLMPRQRIQRQQQPLPNSNQQQNNMGIPFNGNNHRGIYDDRFNYTDPFASAGRRTGGRQQHQPSQRTHNNSGPLQMSAHRSLRYGNHKEEIALSGMNE